MILVTSCHAPFAYLFILISSPYQAQRTELLEEVEDWIATPLTLVATGTPLEKYTGYIVEPALAFNLLAELAAPPAVAEPA